jgi:hypothetical protein
MQVQKVSATFFEKKVAKKLFYSGARDLAVALPQLREAAQKFFDSFFQKRTSS